VTNSEYAEDYPYVLVMDQASQSLFTRLGAERMAGHDIATSLRIFAETCKQVQALHKKRLLHNDIKPRNVLFHRASNRVVLCDLDAAMTLGQDRSRDDKPSSSAYYAPEVARWVLACEDAASCEAARQRRMVAGAMKRWQFAQLSAAWNTWRAVAAELQRQEMLVRGVMRLLETKLAAAWTTWRDNSAKLKFEQQRLGLAALDSTTTPQLKATEALDVWALGVLLYELCSGQRLTLTLA